MPGFESSQIVLQRPSTDLNRRARWTRSQSSQRQPPSQPTLSKICGTPTASSLCPSLDCRARDQQQLRLQFSVVGSLARDLSCAAGGRARRNDYWHRFIPGSKRIALGPDADATVQCRRVLSELRHWAREIKTVSIQCQAPATQPALALEWLRGNASRYYLGPKRGAPAPERN